MGGEPGYSSIKQDIDELSEELFGHGRLRKENAQVDRGQERFDQEIGVDTARQFTAVNRARQNRDPPIEPLPPECSDLLAHI